MAITITDATFQHDVLNSKKPVIVYLWASWCQPCKALAPEIAEVERLHGTKVTIGKVNVDENAAIVSSLEIKSVPTILFYAGNAAAPIAIIGATTARTIISRFRLEELSD
jgi:thioredoxin 1